MSSVFRLTSELSSNIISPQKNVLQTIFFQKKIISFKGNFDIFWLK